MPSRYLFYFLGSMAIFALIYLSTVTTSEIASRLDAQAFISEKLGRRVELLGEFLASSVRPGHDVKASRSQLLEKLSSFKTDNPYLANSTLYQDLVNRRRSIYGELLNKVSESPVPHADAPSVAALKALHVQEMQLLDQIRDEVKAQVVRFIILAALLILLAIVAIATPLNMQHGQMLSAMRSSNDALKKKAAELSATHLTIGNMLQDMVYERKQAQQTSEANARLAAIINSAEDAIFSLSLSGFVTTANRAALKVFGEHSFGKRFCDLFDVENANLIRSILKTTETSMTGATLDLTLGDRYARVDFAMTISPIVNDARQTVGFSVIAKDVSDTKLIEERFRLAVEAAPNAMIMVNQSGKVILANSEAEAIFGYDKSELYRMSIHELVPSSRAVAHREHMKYFMANPNSRTMARDMRDIHGRRKNGEQFPVEVGLTPIMLDNETHVISSIIDISERVEQQQALSSLNEELSRKNKEMEQFIYTVSHDLKAPLVTISGFTNRLLNKDAHNLNDKQVHQLGRIAANVKAMENLLQDLLHLSRVIKRELDKHWVATEKVLKATFNSLEGSINKSHAVIDVQPPLPELYVQESLLFQCFQNILSNSIKYAKPDEPPFITVAGAEEPGYAGIRFSDQGIGIARKHQERIFNVFERLQPDTCEGTGVGLSIVKTILEKHEGKLLVDSDFGMGATFTLLFPVPTRGDVSS